MELEAPKFPKNVPHPIPYQGSKRAIAPQILKFIPSDATTLIEPFAGSAAVTLASACCGLTDKVTIGDVNRSLMDLWKAVLTTPQDLSDGYERLWYAQLGQERTYYDHVRGSFNETGEPAYFLFLLARCVKASIRYNATGLFNQSPDNRRRGAKPSTMRKHIYGAHVLLSGSTEVHAGDFRGILETATEDDVVYMDPPYQGVTNGADSRYKQGIEYQEFCDYLRNMNSRGLSYILSYDGRRDDRSYGKQLPGDLQLTRYEIDAGRSTQATLLGRVERTYESIFISPALTERLGGGDAGLAIQSEDGVDSRESTLF